MSNFVEEQQDKAHGNYIAIRRIALDTFPNIHTRERWLKDQVNQIVADTIIATCEEALKKEEAYSKQNMVGSIQNHVDSAHLRNIIHQAKEGKR